MGRKYVPLVDWQPSIPNPSSFQVPSREKKAIKITTPSGEDIPSLQQPREKRSKTSKPSSHSSDKPTLNNSEGEKLLTASPTRTGDFEEFSKTASSSRPGMVSSNLSQKLAKSQLELGTVISSSRAKDTPQVYRMDQRLSSSSQPEVTEQIAKQQWRPDIFVHAFVPKSLTAINDSPAYLDKTIAGKGVDFEAYTSTFAATRFLPASVEPSSWQSSPTPVVDRLDHLSSVNYGRYFRDCLLLDLEAQIPELRSYDLFKVLLETLHVGQRYRLKVPGLREGTPSVNLGDFVLLRQLILDPVTQLPQGMDAWLAPGGGCSRGEPAPGFTKVQIRALVSAVDKTNESLIIDVNGRIIPGMPVCNVSFIAQPSLVESLHRAVEDVSQELSNQSATATVTPLGISSHLSSERIHNNWLRCMLFPLEANGLQQTTLPSATFSQTWFDRALNYEQKKAVDAIQSCNYGQLPYLINGPPGTGKTKTICEVVMQLSHDSALKGSILLCAPSNSAADTLALRLRAHLDPKKMLRLNSSSRTFAEVPQELLPYCYVMDDRFNIPPFEKLMLLKVVITACKDADMLVQAKVSNRDLIALQKNMSMAIHPECSADTIKIASPLHWAALVVDEAAQATEPEILIPLTVVAPHTAYPCTRTPTFVMAGDQHQLNPRTYHKHTTLRISLFERLSSCPVYASHPLARKSLHRVSQTSPMLRPPFVHLIRNYRSHRAILAVPSSLFYNNTLIPEALNADALQAWTGWRGRRWPVVFACNGGPDECEDIRSVGGGWYNVREARKAVTYARHLLAEKMITNQSEICIMSPFGAQVRLLRKLARNSSLWELNIGPMEAFQGLESRFVIICTTRAQKRFLEQDRIRGLGIVNEKKKFNVAITRSKQGLIVIGNPWVLATDPCWLAFMNFCRRNELWTGDYEEEDQRMRGLEEANVNGWRTAQDSATGNGEAAKITGLEAALIFKERDKDVGSRAAKRFMSGSESLDDAMWRAGLEAEASLELTDEDEPLG